MQGKTSPGDRAGLTTTDVRCESVVTFSLPASVASPASCESTAGPLPPRAGAASRDLHPLSDTTTTIDTILLQEMRHYSQLRLLLIFRRNHNTELLNNHCRYQGEISKLFSFHHS